MRQEGEPSVEDILRSIKQVIARDDATMREEVAEAIERPRPDAAEPMAMPQVGPNEDFPPRENGPAEPAGHDGVLDLAADDALAAPDEYEVDDGEGDFATDGDTLIAGDTAAAARASLASLREIPQAAPPSPAAVDNGLEGMVREMLRPMLREWLDANLPGLIERMVAREISRITGAR